MKKLFFMGFLVSIFGACKDKNEPTIQETVAGVYDIKGWNGNGIACNSGYLIIREDSLGLLDIKVTCLFNGNDVSSTHDFIDLGIRESSVKKVPYVSGAEILYQLYHPKTNLEAGLVYNYPSFDPTLVLLLRARTIKGDSVSFAAAKRTQ